MVCPKCSSPNVESRYADNDYNNYYMYKTSAKIMILLWLLAGKTGKEKENEKSCCQDCGFVWCASDYSLHLKHKKYIEAILGENEVIRYPAVAGGYLQLDDRGVLIRHPKKRFSGVPYDQLAVIGYGEKQDPFLGWITIRHKGNKKKPLPETIDQAKKDKTTVIYDDTYAEGYHLLMDNLTAIAEENKRAGVIY